jgi:hypothetical protein
LVGQSWLSYVGQRVRGAFYMMELIGGAEELRYMFRQFTVRWLSLCIETRDFNRYKILFHNELFYHFKKLIPPEIIFNHCL